MAKPPGAADRLPLRWVGNAKRALRDMPEEVRRDFGRRLNLAQRGRLPPDTKLLHGFGGGVFEMVEAFDGDAYRGVYLARYQMAIYVLHFFQKKSPKGRKMARLDVEAIEEALKSAMDDYRDN
jgi:phage-related protein